MYLSCKMRRRRYIMYLTLLPFVFIYILGVVTRSTSLRQQHDHQSSLSQWHINTKPNKTFSKDESYLTKSVFYREYLLNKSYDTCADIFNLNQASKEFLFPLHSSDRADIPWTDEQMENVLLYKAELANILQNSDLQGNSGNFPDQQRLYYEIAQMEYVETVCETGFNAGHSALIWLNSNNNIRLFSFDIGEHFYTKPAVQLLQSMFPGRFNIKYGDSRWTIPEFHRIYPNVTCDLIVIDGGHYGNVPMKDLYNFRELAAERNLIILDDQPGPEYFKDSINALWSKSIAKQVVKELFMCKNDRRLATLDRDKGITLGRYI